jgi:hypothetical protein
MVKYLHQPRIIRKVYRKTFKLIKHCVSHKEAIIHFSHRRGIIIQALGTWTRVMYASETPWQTKSLMPLPPARQ